MFEMFNSDDKDAISLLKQDHEKVKDLFEAFEKSESRQERRSIAKQAMLELKIHAAVEEEIFYPALRPQLHKEIMNEANEEHHVAKLLIAELDQMDGTEEHYNAKFHVLAESVRHHIREEEGEMMAEARRQDVDFEALGELILQRKEELKANGVPPVGEELMAIAGKEDGDSPALTAERGGRPKVISLVASNSRPRKSAGGSRKKESASSRRSSRKTAGKKTGASARGSKSKSGLKLVRKNARSQGKSQSKSQSKSSKRTSSNGRSRSNGRRAGAQH